MGFDIALTGTVIFFTFCYMSSAWSGQSIAEFCKLVAGLSFFAIPIGLIIQIWQ